MTRAGKDDKLAQGFPAHCAAPTIAAALACVLSGPSLQTPVGSLVVVLAGTNHIAGVTGPRSNEDIEANYASMAELARAHRIRMVFASVLSVHNYTHDAEESFALRPRDRILALIKWL